MLTASAQRCSRGTAIEVGSDRDKAIRYTVTFRPEGTTCTCPGGVYRHRCKHTARAEALRCTWTSADGEPQDRDGACPRCGAATVTDQPPSETTEFRITITLTGPATTMTARSMACEPFTAGHSPDFARRHTATTIELARALAAATGRCTSCTLESLSAELLSAARLLHHVV
jgi:hypothetical protein